MIPPSKIAARGCCQESLMALSLGLTKPKRHPGSRSAGPQGRSFLEAIPDSLALRLRRFSAEQATSTTATLLTAFVVLLHRYTRGETELTVAVNATRRMSLAAISSAPSPAAMTAAV